MARALVGVALTVLWVALLVAAAIFIVVGALMVTSSDGPHLDDAIPAFVIGVVLAGAGLLLRKVG